MSDRILVTGGAGFIGSHIVDAFVAAGHDVVVVDNLHTGHRENVNPKARFYKLDIRDADGLKRLLEEEKPSVISHQAALADVRGSLREPALYAEANVIGTLNLLEAARAAGSVRKLLFASTGGAIYGDPAELPATESCPPHPLDPYGASKLSCEHFIETYRHNYGLDYCILRYGNIYGPRQDPKGEAGVVAIFTGAMLESKPTVINGDGTQARDFTFGPDIARANVLAAGRGSGIYNLGTGVPTDVNTIFRKLAALTTYAQPEKHGPAKPGEVKTTYLDASRAARDLGWKAEVSLDQGLAETVAYFSRTGISDKK
jgi:UDP-glucose 4-epimerase